MGKILKKITNHRENKKKSVEDTAHAQKIRISLERRTYNAGILIQKEIPEDISKSLAHKKHVALGKLHDFRIAVEDMLNEMTISVEKER